MTDLFQPETEMPDAKAVALAQETPVARSESASLMESIIAAASNPAMNVETLERLMAMHERMSKSRAEQAYDAAMSDAQGEMRPVAADASNPQTKSRYASYSALDKAMRPIYTKHGFGLSYDTDDSPLPDQVRVVCRVSHRDGDRRVHHVDMPNDGKGAKGGDVMTKTHAQGAALSYAQRYLLKLIFNIAVGDDDDGNTNGGRDRGPAFEAAVAAVNACETLDDLRDWKTKHAAGLDLLPASDASEIIRLVNSRVAKLKGDAS